MEFKELEIKSDQSWLKRILSSRQTRRSLTFAVVGAIAGFLIFYFSEGRHMEVLRFADILKSTVIGGIFGLMITNSPCARGRC